MRTSPGFIEPCLPTVSRTVPTGAGWAYEIKHDGFRFICQQSPPQSSHPSGPPMTLGNITRWACITRSALGSFHRAIDLFVPRSKPRPYRVVRACFVRLLPQPTFDRHAQGTSAIRVLDCVFSSRAARTAALSPDIPVLLVSLLIDPFPNGPRTAAVLGWGQDGYP